MKRPGTTRTAFGLVATLTLFAVASPASAQTRAPAAQATVVLRAVLLRGLAVSSVSELDFGDLLSSPTEGGQVTVAPTGEVTSSRQSLLAPTGSARRPASFRVSGQPNAFYIVSLQASSALRNGSATMPLTNFTYALAGAGVGGPGRLDGSGAQDLKVGATLSISPDQAPGEYVGGFSVTVTYQ